MSDFRREERYLVAKIKHLSDEQSRQIIDLLESFNHPPLECVVVESDWPNYSDTWFSIELVANGDYQSPYDLLEQQQARIAELELAVCALVVADETGYADGEGFIDGFDKLTSEGEKLLAERDAEVARKALWTFHDTQGWSEDDDDTIYFVGQCLRSFADEYAERIKDGEV